MSEGNSKPLASKSIQRVWETDLHDISCLGVIQVAYMWFELEECGSRSMKGNI